MRAILLLLFLAGPAAAQTVRGIVVGEDEAPIEGAEVVFSGRILATDAQGRFVIERVATGRHTLTIRLIGYHPTRTDVTVGAGEPVELRVVLVAVPPHMLPPVVVSGRRTGLHGVVGDSTFQPVAGARVQLMGTRGGDSRTDSLGRFAFPAARGNFLVRISLPGHRERRFSVTIPPDSGREVTVRLSPADHQYRPPGNVELAALYDLERRLAWAMTRDVLTRDDLARFGTRSLCDVPVIAILLGESTFARLDGWTIIPNVCRWRADQVELIELSWSRPGTRRAGPVRTEWPVGRRGTIIVWQRW